MGTHIYPVGVSCAVACGAEPVCLRQPEKRRSRVDRTHQGLELPHQLLAPQRGPKLLHQALCADFDQRLADRGAGTQQSVKVSREAR